MENIMTCLKWRGDLSFQERSFCEVDNLILSKLAYLDLAGIIPGVEENGSISIKKTSEINYQEHRSNQRLRNKERPFQD